MTPEEVLAHIRETADRQDAFAGPEYTQHEGADRQAFRHAARLLRIVADRLESKWKEKPS